MEDLLMAPRNDYPCADPELPCLGKQAYSQSIGDPIVGVKV